MVYRKEKRNYIIDDHPSAPCDYYYYLLGTISHMPLKSVREIKYLDSSETLKEKKTKQVFDYIYIYKLTPLSYSSKLLYSKSLSHVLPSIDTF